MNTHFILRAGELYWCSFRGWTPHRSSAERYPSKHDALCARVDLESDRDVVPVRVVGERAS